jgi:hypothetical protein
MEVSSNGYSEADRLLDRIVELIDELLQRYEVVYGVEPRAKHRVAALAMVCERLTRELSPRPQPADLADDETVKRLARVAWRIGVGPSLHIVEDENLPQEEQLVREVANVLLSALAECGRLLDGVSADDFELF